VNDFFHFVVAFFEVISTSAPHIYHSTLLLSPRTSSVRKLYEPYAFPLVRVVQGIPVSWEPIVATSSHRVPIHNIVWSPCSRYIAVSSGDPPMIEILDALTLRQLHKFDSQDRHEWLSFSPDSRSLTQFSLSRSRLTTQDLQTGGQINTIPFISHTADSRYLSSTYSVDGKMFAVAYRDSESTGISTYNLLSGTHTHSHRAPDGHIVAPIWTHGEFLRFVTVKPGSITVWEVGFTSTHTLTKVESLPTPGNDHHFQPILFLPTLSRLAFYRYEEVMIWDARDSKLLLNTSGDRPMSFSSDGQFFACGTPDEEIHLWKESPAGYLLHRKIIPGITKEVGCDHVHHSIEPFLSPDGESIIASMGYKIHLWRTTDPITSLSSVPTRPTGEDDFILEFSPDGSLVAIARKGEKTATVLDLKSGNPRLVIDTGVGVHSMRVTEDAIVVAGKGWIIAWNLPAGEHVLGARADVDDNVRAMTFSHPELFPKRSQSVAISPDLNYAVITRGLKGSEGLDIFDLSTGNHLVGTATDYALAPWITPDGCEVWFSSHGGWKINKDGKSNIIGLDPLPKNAQPSGGYYWSSPHDHHFTGDGSWIFNSRKKRLMWFPQHWRHALWDWTWNGWFLGSLNYELPEPVIIDLSE